jgi:outer membrane protein TolC
LQKAVDIALENSYQIKRLELGIERTRYRLQARHAGLKSKVYLYLRSPEIKALSDYKWNSEEQVDEIVRQNTLRWQADLSIRQPIILFGYPTNGYLSLNNKLYQYVQKIDGTKDTNYYNRYFIEFSQPLLQENYLKNDFEQAELDLEREELEFNTDRANVINRTARGYYNLFELSYKNEIFSNHLSNLQHVSSIVNQTLQDNATRTPESIQVQVALSNSREQLLENQSNLRLETMRVKQDLRINIEDSLIVDPVIQITPIIVDLEQALQYGYTLRPTLRLLEINRRRNEIGLQETKSRGAFHLNLAMTYGLEKYDEMYQQLWKEQDNSYSVSIRAYIPIWDWGLRKSNIEASKISIKRTNLSIEENRNEIRSEITNIIANLEEYQRRALNMMKNMEVAKELSAASITQFSENRISVRDILKILERQKETELNFIEAYLSYKRSLIRLMVNTHYDFENNISLIDKFCKEL